MNKGMKNNTKQLTQQVGNVNIGVNICKQDANLHITVPLISTIGLSPVDMGLIFNLQDRSENGMFGYGCRLDKYMYVQSIAGGYSVTNADGSVDKYLSNDGLYNKQTELTLSRVSTGEYNTSHYYTLTDKYDNIIKLNEADEYPKTITTKSGDNYTYDFISVIKTIDNNHGDVVTLSRNNNTLINRVEYKHNGTLMGYTLLDYTDNYLTKIGYHYVYLFLAPNEVNDMGMPDFYLKINFKKHNYDEYENIYRSFISESIFRILDKELKSNFLSLECKFDNLIPSIIIVYNNLYPFKDSIDSIETHGIVKAFTFTSVEEFLDYVFSVNKNQLLSYYKQLGYLAIDSEKYYKSRIKLKKYYKKLK